MIQKLLGKLGKFLYLKYGKPDFAAMTRAQIWGKPAHTAFEDLPKEDQQRIAMDCLVISKNPSFHYVADEIIEETVDNIAYKANNETLMLCDRFTINGVSLFEERIKKYSAQVEQPEEPFDKHEAI